MSSKLARETVERRVNIDRENIRATDRYIGWSKEEVGIYMTKVLLNKLAQGFVSFPVSNIRVSGIRMDSCRAAYLIWQLLSQYWTDMHPVHFDMERFGVSFFVNWHIGLLQPIRGTV